jgi:hypothetical protein
MHLGRSPTESMLPPRFERLYQPEKLAQFDRFFSRSWATPVRRSHAAQHGSDASDELSEYQRNIYRPLSNTKKSESCSDVNVCVKDEYHEVLNHVISKHGFEPRKRTTLRRFVQHHDIIHDDIATSRSILSADDETYEDHPSYRYIGDKNKWIEKPREEYLRCVRHSKYLTSSQYKPNAFEEFKESLHASSINVNEVDEIQELAESAHVGQEIKSGPYKGLDRNFSAIEFSTVVFEHLNAYEHIRRRGKLRDGISVMDAELMRRGFYIDGIREAIADGWDQHMTSEKQYHETCLPCSSKYRRSDFTTANSLRLYTSFFSPDQAMVVPDVAVLLGETPSSEVRRKPGHVHVKDRGNDFVAKAAKKGIAITSHEDICKSQPLFSFGRKHAVPPGFEMINEDMFSRKDNKFMVFNGPGVDSWAGNTPMTKISGIERMLAGTF